MKTLIIYTKDSHYKFHNLYEKYFYEFSPESMLCIYEKEICTGQENLVATFNNWDYFLIETKQFGEE